jgi:uncharacterized protein YjbI with pentapeptide repeats
MANEEHLAQLLQGVDAWNQWRAAHPESTPDLSRIHFPQVNLSQAYLGGADLTGCVVYGISAWGVQLNAETPQQGLIISLRGEPAITVDHLEVAQFIYMAASQ